MPSLIWRQASTVFFKLIRARAGRRRLSGTQTGVWDFFTQPGFIEADMVAHTTPHRL